MPRTDPITRKYAAVRQRLDELGDALGRNHDIDPDPDLVASILRCLRKVEESVTEATLFLAMARIEAARQGAA